MDAEWDWDRLRGELGIAGFARLLANDRNAKAAWDRHRQSEADREEPPPAKPTHLWRVSEHGRDHPICRIPIGRRHRVTALGDLVVVQRHWEGSSGRICIGKTCKLCPSERRREGYFDAIARRILRDQTEEEFRCIQAVPAAVIDALEGMPLRSRRLVFFRRGERARTELGTDGEDVGELPPAIDVRTPLMRLWGLTIWPSDEASESGAEEPSILRFRKQA